MIAGLGILAVGHQGHLPVVVDEADPGQALVGDPRAQLHRVEVAERDGPLREGAMERDHQRLVLGADRAGGRAGAVLGGPGDRRIGSDTGGWRAEESRVVDVPVVDDHPGVQRQEPVRRGEQGIDVDLLDPALLDDQMAEADQKLLERGQVHRLCGRARL